MTRVLGRAVPLTCLLLSFACGARAEAPPSEAVALDERRVVRLALDGHPDVLRAEALRDAARAGARGAQLTRLPDVKVSGHYTRYSSLPKRYRTVDGILFPQQLNSAIVRTTLILPITDTFLELAASARAAGREAEAARIELTHARAQVAFDARLAFLRYWSRTLAVVNATEFLHDAEENARDQRIRKQAGTVARNEVLPFETALDSAAMSLEAARAELAEAEANLRTFFPQLADQPLSVPELPETLHDEVAPRVPRAPREAPRIAAIAQHAKAAEARAEAASLARLPTLAAVGSVDVSAPNPRLFVIETMQPFTTWEAGVTLEWSLSQLTAGSARTQEARRLHRALEAQLAAAKRILHGERTGAAGVLLAAQARVLRARQRVEHAAELARARRGELEAGTALPLNVVLAEADLVRAKNEHVDAVVQRAIALAKLDFIDGRTEPTSTPTPGLP
ncbi:MAG: TolC family protein [Polyangiales bacterium]